MHMNRFCFIDSSGIIKNDKFFGTGLLIVKNVGDMIDKLAKNAQPAYSDAKQAKDKVIEKLISRGEYDQIIKILDNAFLIITLKIGDKPKGPNKVVLINRFLDLV